MLQYFARKFFAGDLISPYMNGSNVTVSYISDSEIPANVVVTGHCLHYESFTSHYDWNITFHKVYKSLSPLKSDVISINLIKFFWSSLMIDLCSNDSEFLSSVDIQITFDSVHMSRVVLHSHTCLFFFYFFAHIFVYCMFCTIKNYN